MIVAIAMRIGSRRARFGARRNWRSKFHQAKAADHRKKPVWATVPVYAMPPRMARGYPKHQIVQTIRVANVPKDEFCAYTVFAVTNH
jgi:hypothetical protein